MILYCCVVANLIHFCKHGVILSPEKLSTPEGPDLATILYDKPGASYYGALYFWLYNLFFYSRQISFARFPATFQQD